MRSAMKEMNISRPFASLGFRVFTMLASFLLTPSPRKGWTSNEDKFLPL